MQEQLKPTLGDRLRALNLSLSQYAETETQARQKADHDLKQALQQLKADFQTAMKTLEDALDRLNTPPDKEEAPVIRELQEDVDELYSRVEKLAQNQAYILKRLPPQPGA